MKLQEEFGSEQFSSASDLVIWASNVLADWFVILIFNSAQALWHALESLLYPALFFAGLALIIKRRRLFQDFRQALPETTITLSLMAFNIVFVLPLLTIFLLWLTETGERFGFRIVDEQFWKQLPEPLVIFLAVFLGDFIGYWRHRLEHSPLLWPSHAVHHSDTEMTWLALERFHPVNRVTTVVIDNTVLLLLGFPPYVLIANNLVRHYYGYFIHADLPWTYGLLGKIFVSPSMHRWHHAADYRAFNTNFATVFSLFDVVFGTYRVPAPTPTQLGVTDNMGDGVIGQLSYPFKPNGYRRVWRRLTGGADPAA
ncbi:sterol desaturase family protein [Kiloniella laminariae]|uniref:sterol desaturase family protein n=1 Tax=Kiloniella laminariae TaxID=454162 RepID=UPI0003826280|nr:sterol desaturase family protein [Kiloniella laminariae]